MEKQYAVIIFAHFYVELKHIHLEIDDLKASSEHLSRKYQYGVLHSDEQHVSHRLLKINSSVKLMQRLSDLVRRKAELQQLMLHLPLSTQERQEIKEKHEAILNATNVDLFVLRDSFISYLEEEEAYEMCTLLLGANFYSLAA